MTNEEIKKAREFYGFYNWVSDKDVERTVRMFILEKKQGSQYAEERLKYLTYKY